MVTIGNDMDHVARCKQIRDLGVATRSSKILEFLKPPVVSNAQRVRCRASERPHECECK